VPSQEHELRGARAGLRLVLRVTLLAPFDLAPPAAASRRGARLSGDELSLQALEPLLAPADQTPPDGHGLATAHRAVAAAPSAPADAARRARRRGRHRKRRRELRERRRVT